MIEAMWAVVFSTPEGIFGTGVVVFETKRVFGGDSMYFYMGSYTVTENAIQAQVRVQHYSGPKSNILGMGIDSLDLTVTGQIKDAQHVTAQGIDPRFPRQPITMDFRKIADLPPTGPGNRAFSSKYT